MHHYFTLKIRSITHEKKYEYSFEMTEPNSRSLLSKIKIRKSTVHSTSFFILDALKKFFKSSYCHDDIIKLIKTKPSSDTSNVLTFTLK